MSGSIPEDGIDDCGSGPYCKHWNEPSDCCSCARELIADEIAKELAEARLDERRKVLLEVMTFSRGGDYAQGYNKASLETEEWARNQLAELAKRGDGGT